MLGNLDNEVIFKKAFGNKEVFQGFVRDVLGIEVEVDVIETEKRFDPKIGYIDFKMDIFAETTDKRICIEIQRVEYDYHFDRFLHYFLMMIAQQQKNSKEYTINQTVYVIVVLTAPYKINEKDGKPILDEVLLLKLNPVNLRGEVRNLYDHKFMCLNPNHPSPETPPQIRDWLDLIYQSIYSPERPVLNIKNAGIKKAMELINFDNLTPEERTQSKNKEAAKIVLTIEKESGKKEAKNEIAQKMILESFADDLIIKMTGLTLKKVQELRNLIKN